MELGKKVFNKREEKNISQKLLAKQLGISKKQLIKWETCEEVPNIQYINKLSEVLDISFNDLIDNDIRNLISKRSSKNKEESNLTFLYKLVGTILLILILIWILFSL